MLQYLGIVVLPAAWFVFALRYTGRWHWVTTRLIALLCVEPVAVLLLVFTNESHGLFWERTDLGSLTSFAVLSRPHGPTYWAHTVYSYVLFLVAVFLLLQMLVRSWHLYRRQVGIMLIGATIPLLGNLLVQLDVPPPYLDLTPVSFLLSSLVMTWALPFLRLEDITPVTRGLIVESMSDGVIVLDNRERVVDINSVAQTIIGNSAANVVGRLLQEVWSDLGGLVEGLGRETRTGEIMWGVGEGQRVFDARLSPILDWRGDVATRVVVLRDITDRKRAEQALQFTQFTVERAADAAFWMGPDARFVYVNQAACQSLGYSREELLALTVHDIDPDFTPEVWPSHWEEVRQRGAFSLESQHRTKEGRVFPVEITVNYVQFVGEEYNCAFARDITERKQAEAALRRERDFAALVAETSPVGIVVLDREGQITFANAQVERVLGLTNEEISQMTFNAPRWRITDHEGHSFPAEEVIFRQVMLTGQPLYDVRIAIESESSRRTFLLVNAAPIGAESTEASGIVLTVMDVTESVLADETLRRRNRELATLHEIARDISATLDSQLVLERIATYARDLLETDESEVYLLEPGGETLRAIVALGGYANEIKAELIQVGEGFVGRVAESGESLVVDDVSQDARAMHIPGTPDESHALMCTPLNYRGQVMGVMSVARDALGGPFDKDDLSFLEGLAQHAAIAIENARLFTAEHQRTTELAWALEQQQQLDRLKDEFVHNVSHELRSPLALIRGYAEMLDTGELGELLPDQRKPVEVIARRSRMLGELVQDIMLILEVEITPPELGAVSLDELIKAVVEDFDLAISDAGLNLEVDVPAALPKVTGVPTYIRRVFDNLIGNALKFTPEGGTITLQLRPEDEWVVLKVSDTGIGIAPGQQERIFERFYQVDGSSKRRFGGAGLGLTLVREIAELCGGRVSVESEVGEGSTFFVTLPVHQGGEVES